MSPPESFQHRSFRFAIAILRLYRKLNATTDLPKHIGSQMLRAGTAIGANLEEARSAYSRRDLAARQTIALREARECHYWIRLVRADQPRLDDLTPLLDEAEQIIAMLTASVRKLRHAPSASAQ